MMSSTGIAEAVRLLPLFIPSHEGGRPPLLSFAKDKGEKRGIPLTFSPSCLSPASPRALCASEPQSLQAVSAQTFILMFWVPSDMTPSCMKVLVAKGLLCPLRRRRSGSSPKASGCQNRRPGMWSHFPTATSGDSHPFPRVLSGAAASLQVGTVAPELEWDAVHRRLHRPMQRYSRRPPRLPPLQVLLRRFIRQGEGGEHLPARPDLVHQYPPSQQRQ